MTARRHISLKTKLAAVLCQMLRVDENGKLVPTISHQEAKTMSDEAVLAFFDWHHVIPHALGGSDHHSNLMPIQTDEHRERTAKIDVPAIAKEKRVTRKEEEFRRRLLAKGGQGEAPEPKRSKWASRPFPKSKGFAR